GLDEPEPESLASREDTNEVDAHHACGRHLRRRVHRPGGACASGRHVAHEVRLRDAAGARRREPALLRHLCVWGSQAAVRLQLLSDQARYDYLLWDTGHAMTTPNVAPKVSIVDQLEKIGVKVDQIKYVGI